MTAITEVAAPPPDDLSAWQDYLENMKRIGADSAPWLAHIRTMRQVRANVVTREAIRRVSGSVEQIIAGRGRGPTLCFIHSVLGISTEVLDLADMLGPDHRLLSIRPASANRNKGFPSSIEKMAEEYVNSLVEIQPAGDFVLCGRSAGVVIGLHMAQLLIERGRAVRLFAALDFAPYNTGADIGRFNLQHNYQILRNWTHQACHHLKESASYRDAVGAIRREIHKKIAPQAGDQSKPKHPIVVESELCKYSPAELAFVDECDRAMKQYEYRKKHDFPILVFLSTKQPERSEYNVVAKWRRIVRSADLRIIEIPGTTHRNIAEKPFVLAVANDLRRELVMLS